MADDIEAFLRRAAQRRKEQAGRKQSRAPRPRPEYSNRNTERVAQQQRPEDVVLDVEVIDDNVGLSQLENRHLQGDHLAAAISQADERMNAHISEAFDDTVATHRSNAAFETGQAMADGDIAKTLISLLQSPAGLQQALLLREIIDRPTHRWD